ncbi:MAG: MtnX-like HAD-IB family phosphatase [Proteobacteria bacterium]|nr:MtnX-like HAD-IB family phosphatase [Pseudomonadota bacterium]
MSDWIILCDFDGTISVEDVTDSLLERHAHPDWTLIERQWKAGAIGSRQCLQDQIDLLDADPRQLEALYATMRIDRAFPAFVEAALSARIPVRIVSDGLDKAIETILARHQIEHLPIAANHIAPDGPRRWRLEFPHARADCKVASGLCKCAQVTQARKQRPKVLLIGDGASDFCAASRVDLVFAKHRLIEHCRSQGLPYVPITGFTDAIALLPALLEGSLEPVPPAHLSVHTPASHSHA